MTAPRRPKIGFIGFGEVAASLSQQMQWKGADILGYDKSPDKAAQRAETLGIPLVAGIEELVASTTYLLSTLWPDAAVDTALEAAPHLTVGKVYCDFNSISPQATRQIETIIRQRDAQFVKVAIMAAIPDRGPSVPLLAGGESAKEVTALLSELGLNVQYMGTDAAKPAAMKILRAVCLKGIVALCYEMLRAAEEYAIGEEVLASASEVLAKAPFSQTVGNWVSSTAIHARRRSREMDEAVETLEDSGVDPIMTKAAKKVFEEIADYGLEGAFGGEIPESYRRVLEEIRNRKES